jgi:hypothetical protein
MLAGKIVDVEKPQGYLNGRADVERKKTPRETPRRQRRGDGNVVAN